MSADPRSGEKKGEEGTSKETGLHGSDLASSHVSHVKVVPVVKEGGNPGPTARKRFGFSNPLKKLPPIGKGLLLMLLGAVIFLISALLLPPIGPSPADLAPDVALGLGISMLAIGSLLILMPAIRFVGGLLGAAALQAFNSVVNHLRTTLRTIEGKALFSILIGGALFLTSALLFPPIDESNATPLAADVALGLGISMLAVAGLLIVVVPVALYARQRYLHNKANAVVSVVGSEPLVAHSEGSFDEGMTWGARLRGDIFSLKGVFVASTVLGLMVIAVSLLLFRPVGVYFDSLNLATDVGRGLGISMLTIGALLTFGPSLIAAGVAFYVKCCKRPSKDGEDFELGNFHAVPDIILIMLG